MTEPDDVRSSCSCKVGRTAEQYSLNNLNARLLNRREAGESLRDLAAYVNRQVLEAALRAADLDLSGSVFGAVSDGDAVAAVYEALNGDNVEPERTARVRMRLTQNGVDIDGVRSDWVTHPTIRSHLQECLDVDTSRSATITRTDARNTVEWARTRCARVVERTVERLGDAGLVSLGGVNVSVTIQVTCTDCGDAFHAGRLLDVDGCSCNGAATRDTNT